MVMIEAGTTIPPIPSPAMMSGPQALSRLSALAMERAPQPLIDVFVRIILLCE